MASQLPVEVELVFELMPCQAERVAQNPGAAPHACAYFRAWGRYHSFDYQTAGPPKPGMQTEAQYVGRAPLVPEMLSGCRKAPILAVGINPNLPGWWPNLRSSLNPLFDDYRQYAHYFRYRGTAKPALSAGDYAAYGGGPADAPPTSTFELNVPADGDGRRTIAMQWQAQKMYLAYQELLDGLASAMGWPAGRLTVGEDLSYGNMVACPSAKWTTAAPKPTEPPLPVMTPAQRDGIVSECFRGRKHFLRQLFQSLPAVILVFSQNTANTFISELGGKFSKGDPQPGETIDDLMKREVVLHYGDLPNGAPIEARVIFGPHPTGNPDAWAAAKDTVAAQLADCATQGRLAFNTKTRRLARPVGSCSFCTTLAIGPCDYLAELNPLATPPALTADRVAGLGPDKAIQQGLLAEFVRTLPEPPADTGWGDSDFDEEG